MISFVKNYSPYIVILLLGLWGIKAFFIPEFYTSHDGPAHLARLAQYIQLLDDGQYPPRWSSSLYGGLGYPIFVYSYHLPFAFGAIFYKLGATLSQSLELVLGSFYLLSGIGMYLWLKELFPKTAALTGAIIFLFSPYRFSLLFVRAAVGEATALACVPFILLFMTKYSKNPTFANMVPTVIAIALAISAHSLFLPVYLPGLFAYLVIAIYVKSKNLRATVKHSIIPIILSLALSAFYWIPLVLERHYIMFDKFYSFNAPNHLVTLAQLWHSPWGYGFSFPDTDNDAMSFQVGLANWLVIIVTLPILFIRAHLHKWVAGFAYFAFVGAIFLMHQNPLAKYIWEHAEILRAVDFPWRLLGLTTLMSAIIGAYLIASLPLRKILTVIMVVAVLVANRNHLRTNLPYVVTDFEMMTERGTTAYANEFLPKWRDTDKRLNFDNRVEAKQSEFYILESKSNSLKIATNFSNPESLQINTLYFPNWRAYEYTGNDKRELALGQDWVIVGPEDDNADIYIGTMRLKADSGARIYQLRYEETTLRKLANIASLVTLLALALGYKLATTKK